MADLKGHDMSLEITAQAARVAALEKALSFYADPANWKSPSTGFLLQYEPEPSRASQVRYSLAQAALNQTEPPA